MGFEPQFNTWTSYHLHTQQLLYALASTDYRLKPYDKHAKKYKTIKPIPPISGHGSVMRRVVVTGLGAITPLGVGARRSWRRLIAAESGIVDVSTTESYHADAERWKGLTSSIAGLVPTGKPGREAGLWSPSDWLDTTEQRRMSNFTQYAIAATEMALTEAAWKPSTPPDLEATGVCLGSGIGNLDDIYSTSLAFEKDVSLPHSSFFKQAKNEASEREHTKLRSIGRVTRKFLLCSSPRSSSTWPPATSP